MAKKSTSKNMEPAQEPAEIQEPILTPQQQLRLSTLEIVLGSEKLRKDFNKIYEDTQGDWTSIREALGQRKAFAKALPHLELAQKVADLTEDNVLLVKAFHRNPKTNSLRDIALKYSPRQLAELVHSIAIPEAETMVEEAPGPEEEAGVSETLTPEAKARVVEAPGPEAEVIEIEVPGPEAEAIEMEVPGLEDYVGKLYTRLFQKEPTAVVQRMIGDPAETPLADIKVGSAVATFLDKQDASFNIKTTSVYDALGREKAFEDIQPELRESVVREVKRLQRAVALSPVPEAVSVLMKADMTSALRVSDLPEQQFVQRFSGELGEEVALQIYTNAVNTRIRNEQTLMAIKELERGTGVAFIDRSMKAEAGPLEEPKQKLNGELDKKNLNWDILFGDADICECGECNSVYSAAAYFVELLQYLRNNNLDKWAAGEIAIKSDPKDITGTPLEKLFNRRPDLGCLELTCKNTNTLLPYIDLVNEVMENYIVYHKPKAFNVEEDQTSGELLAQPHHTEYEAYCILQKAVYPFTLPYHQPIDATRIYLEHLDTSRYELIDTFRSVRKEKPLPAREAEKDCPPDPATSDTQKELDRLHKIFLDRAADAEYLGLTQEEYVILAKEAFVSKAYWEKQCNKSRTDEEYWQKIGLRPVYEYYGYATGEAMLNRDEKAKEGLTFVKDQFLRRTGIEYKDLVELLKTQCLNPNLPQGKALDIMDSVRFSYQYLQQLVNQEAKSAKSKYQKLLEFLKESKNTLPKLDALLHPDPCHASGQPAENSVAIEDLEQWVYLDFERIGKMIVLEGGAACLGPEGVFFIPEEQLDLWYSFLKEIGVSIRDYLFISNNKIIIRSENSFDAAIVGEVGIFNPRTGKISIYYPDGRELDINLYGHFEEISGKSGYISEGFLYHLVVVKDENPPLWICEVSKEDTCDLRAIRLVHLDGSPLDNQEYDRIHRFIRLWRKLGWTIDEVDKALVGLSKKSVECADDLLPEKEECDPGDLFDGTESHSKKSEKEAQNGQLARREINWEITPDFLHQLVAVKKLQEKTGLEVSKLLTFWSDISTAGEKSLYRRLFLTHNLVRLDDVFKADANGNYLVKEAKITNHLPVIMAALNLSADDIAAIIAQAELEDKLTLANISLLYRYRLLSKVLGLRIADFVTLPPLFGDLFEDAKTTLRFMKRWEKMEDAGFNHQQLSYLIRRDYDDPRKPLAPGQKEILQLAKTLYDGINAIEEDHKDLPAEEELTIEWLRAKAVLLFDPPVVDKIVTLLEGTAIFSTNAPINIQTAIDKLDSKKDAAGVAIPPVLASIRRKLNYDPARGRVQITGILTTTEKKEYLSWEDSEEWEKSLKRIEKQQHKLFQEVLSAVFEAEKQEAPDHKERIDEAEAAIKEGDISIPVAEIPVGAKDPNTAPKKRLAFMKVFLPYLRRQLTRRFILDTLSGQVGLDRPVTEVLISEILTGGNPLVPLYEVFASVHSKQAPAAAEWNGYLIPSATANYTFIVREMDSAPKVRIEGTQLMFTRQEDPTNEWWSDPVPLQAAKLYPLTLDHKEWSNLYWKTPTSGISPIPAAQLLPDYASDQTHTALVALKKAAILVNGFNLGPDELRHFHIYKADFDGLDFNHLELEHWLRLEAYTRLRNSLPQADTNLLAFFKWSHQPDDPAQLSKKIAELTRWQEDRISKLIAAEHFNLNQPQAFRNEKTLLKLQKALKIADKIGMDIGLLFDWAKPTSNFRKTRAISDSIRNAIRARYRQEDWEQVVKPLNDKLRENKKQALITYLLQQDDLIRWGVTDADGLFEYFLIDVQMDACMETSRIKQAISSVQLFVQRCFLGLEEEKNSIPPNLLDRGRWDWMQRYRVWEANRKVFLYPENWIESNLRDDKSPFFKELESELLQKDINKQNVTDALKAYLYKVDEVANMEVVGLYVDGSKLYDENGKEYWTEGAKLHVFSRTRNAPYFFYYRYLALDEMNWYPWEKMQVDIPCYDVEDVNGQVIGNGCYLTPVVWNSRLLVFFPQFMKKTKPNDNTKHKSIRGIADEDTPDSSKPLDYWEIKMGWSEYRNGKWTQKQISKDAINDVPAANLIMAAFDTLAREAANKGEIAKESVYKSYDEIEKIKSSINQALGEATQSRDQALTTKGKADAVFQIKLETIITVIVNAIARRFVYLGQAIDDVLATQSEAGKTVTEANQVITAVESAGVQASSAQNFIETVAKRDIDAVVSAINEVLKSTASKAPNLISSLSNYEFVPVPPDDPKVIKKILGIRVFHNSTPLTDAFEFDGTSLKKATAKYSANNLIDVNSFHYNSNTIQSLQTNGSQDHVFENNGLMMYNGNAFYHEHSKELLGYTNSRGLEQFFEYNLTVPDKANAFGKYDSNKDGQIDNNDIYHELKRPYSLYNWELFFHTPVMLADALSKSQQYEEAMKWYHFVFNPMADGTDNKRFWQFLPFRETNAQRILDSIFNRLQPNAHDDAINEWRSHPFQPHLVARSRPVAYMKWVVMKYIDNLIAWGDHLFRQDTIESINQATQLYVLAGHILGPRPQLIPKRGKIQPQTYLSLLDKWDAFSNAMTELEIVAPYSNQIAAPAVSANGEVSFANIFGFASTLYFCIPNNPKLMGYWDTVADRLFKIRHCQNIEGVFRKLALFEPPIDPGLLVKAAAQGLSIAGVLNDLNTPMPNYRFYYLLQKALELCGELKSMGGAILSAIEKKDNEEIALLRAKHESKMHSLVLEVKKRQKDEAVKTVDSLRENRKRPQEQMKYYLKLSGLGEDLVPSENTDFNGLPNQIDTVDGGSGLKLTHSEKLEMDKLNESRIKQIEVGQKELMASILHLLPNLNIAITPLGVGSGFQYGGPFLGGAMQAWAKHLQNEANGITFYANNAGKKAGYQRALQDRIQQASAAGYEVKQIDKQITAQQIRIQIADLEITNQQKQIDNAQEVEEFLRNKYTNEELYTWMRGRLKTLYYQVYSLAYELAKKAEKVYRFERGLSNSNFIQPGYWDAGREGLLAGEQLYVGLKQLEAAYHEHRGYDYEITKHISLRQVNPLAVLQLRETGKCEFALPEVLFDMDYPGHFRRRIKSVSISIPCVAGPYTGLNATLRLLQNKFRNSAIAKDTGDYAAENEERFSSYIIPITGIAASSAQNETGLFELNFKDERYLPFEGAGVISQWRLELPAFRQFDYETISDVVIHLRYTASEGGERLKKAAGEAVLDFLKANNELSQQEGLFAIIDLKHDLPNEWYRALQAKAGDDDKHILQIPRVLDFLPFYTQIDSSGKKLPDDKITVTDVVLVASDDFQALNLSAGSNEQPFSEGILIDKVKTFVIRDSDMKVGDWKLAFIKASEQVDKAVLVLRFVVE